MNENIDKNKLFYEYQDQSNMTPLLISIKFGLKYKIFKKIREISDYLIKNKLSNLKKTNCYKQNLFHIASIYDTGECLECLKNLENLEGFI